MISGFLSLRFVMQTNSAAEDDLSTKTLFFLLFPFHIQISISATEETHLFTTENGAIDINLISKLLFKSKQMDFIVKSYWQYVLRDVKGKAWQKK